MLRSLVALLALLVPHAALAGSQDGAVVAVHLSPHVPGKVLPCDSAPQGGFACDRSSNSSSDFNVTGQVGVGYDAYIVVANTNTTSGVAGVSFGIDYFTTPLIYDSYLCGDEEFPATDWPQPGSRNFVVWDPGTNCQREIDPTDPSGDGYAVAYAFYVFAYDLDELRIQGDDLRVADCTAAESELFQTYWYSAWAGFGKPGKHPCVSGSADFCFFGPRFPTPSDTLRCGDSRVATPAYWRCWSDPCGPDLGQSSRLRGETFLLSLDSESLVTVDAPGVIQGTTSLVLTEDVESGTPPRLGATCNTPDSPLSACLGPGDYYLWITNSESRMESPFTINVQCQDCSVTVEPASWGSIKTRFRTAPQVRPTP